MSSGTTLLKPNTTFSNMPRSFWATVRAVSQEIGYTIRGQNLVKAPTVLEINRAFASLNLNTHVVAENGNPTRLTDDLIAYYGYRADVLNNFVESRLMDVNRARVEFDKLHDSLKPSCPIPMNKQKGEKKAPAYLTGMINMLIEANAEGLPCDYDPRKLTTVTIDGAPLRTLARRIDGAFPSVINSTAIWEIKEYYYGHLAKLPALWI